MSATMSRRLQLLLDEGRYQRVAAEAKKKRLSVAAVIRDAIDESLGGGDSPADKQKAWEELRELTADTSMYSPGWDALEEIRQSRDERARALD